MRIEVEGLVFEIPPNVYRPAEDSLLLMKYAAALKGKILDMGCGCGIQAIANARKNPENSVLGVDLNGRAVECARYNATKNGIENASFAVSDLFENVEGKFDGIIFNPPYLPTAEDERISGELNRAFDGGKDGRLVTDMFLFGFERHLASGGTILLLQSSLNDIGKTVSLLENRGFCVEIREGQEFFFEKICVIEARRL